MSKKPQPMAKRRAKMETLAVRNAMHPPTGKRAKATAAKYAQVLEGMSVGNAPRGNTKEKAIQRKEEEAAAYEVLKKHGLDQLASQPPRITRTQNTERLLKAGSKRRPKPATDPATDPASKPADPTLIPKSLSSDQSISVLGDTVTPIMELFSGYQFKFPDMSTNNLPVEAKKTPINVARFLEFIYLTGNLSGACQHINVSFATIGKWRREDPVFAAAMDEAKERHKDVIEDAIHQRGIVGIDKPVFQGGKLVGYQREYSDSLLIAKAKAYIPEKYGDKLHIEQDTNVKVEMPKEIAELIASVTRPVIDITPKPNQIEHRENKE